MSKYDEESAELCEALDALDAAHAEEVREAREDGYQEGLRDARANLVADRREGWVELPRDADGKIWTGREVCFWTGSADGDWHKFNGLAYIDGRWCVEDNDFERYPAVSVWYERPDGLERIADELDEWCDYVYVDGDACDKPRELAERIRRLADNCSKAEKKEDRQ